MTLKEIFAAVLVSGVTSGAMLITGFSAFRKNIDDANATMLRAEKVTAESKHVISSLEKSLERANSQINRAEALMENINSSTEHLITRVQGTSARAEEVLQRADRVVSNVNETLVNSESTLDRFDELLGDGKSSGASRCPIFHYIKTRIAKFLVKRSDK